MIVAISAVYWDEALILILSPSKTVKIKSKTKLHFYFHLLCALDLGGGGFFIQTFIKFTVGIVGVFLSSLSGQRH